MKKKNRIITAAIAIPLGLFGIYATYQLFKQARIEHISANIEVTGEIIKEGISAGKDGIWGTKDDCYEVVVRTGDGLEQTVNFFSNSSGNDYFPRANLELMDQNYNVGDTASFSYVDVDAKGRAAGWFVGGTFAGIGTVITKIVGWVNFYRINNPGEWEVDYGDRQPSLEKNMAATRINNLDIPDDVKAIRKKYAIK